MRLVTLLGTRPEIIKMAPLLPRLDEGYEHLLVHSGQHYSREMDRIFFEELSLRAPGVHLEVGSHPAGTQTGRIMERFEAALPSPLPAAILVQGDTNTALAGALVAAKLRSQGVLLVHVEAGTRSHNPLQPEEINRKLIDRVSDLLFVPEERDLENLRREGVDLSRAFVTGNTVVESCLRTAALSASRQTPARYGLAPERYAVATFHRQETVDEEPKLRAIYEALLAVGRRLPVLVPLHPRTRKMMGRFGLGLEAPGVRFIEPLGYVDMIDLLGHSRFCLTDSGGLVEEAAVLGIPALVLRTETEHRQYVECGIHTLVGSDRARIENEAARLVEDGETYRLRRTVSVPVRRGAPEVILQTLRARLGRLVPAAEPSA